MYTIVVIRTSNKLCVTSFETRLRVLLIKTHTNYKHFKILHIYWVFFGENTWWLNRPKKKKLRYQNVYKRKVCRNNIVHFQPTLQWICVNLLLFWDSCLSYFYSEYSLLGCYQLERTNKIRFWTKEVSCNNNCGNRRISKHSTLYVTVYKMVKIFKQNNIFIDAWKIHRLVRAISKISPIRFCNVI